MTTTIPQSPEPHEAALLLPWYVGGTLVAREHLAVEEHLRDCMVCRGELESLTSLRKRTRIFFGSAPPPTPRLHAEVAARVRRSQAGSARGAPPLIASIGAALQRLMRPNWAPALAVLLIVGQAGILGWFALRPSGPEHGIQSRGLAPAGTRIRVVFNPQASQRDVRSALDALGGRIVDGPLPGGAYVIELPAVAPKILSERLRELRSRPGIVERIENAAP